jgi:hypothetical protein
MNQDRSTRKQSDDTGPATMQKGDRFPKSAAWRLMPQRCCCHSPGHCIHIIKADHRRVEQLLAFLWKRGVEIEEVCRARLDSWLSQDFGVRLPMLVQTLINLERGPE